MPAFINKFWVSLTEPVSLSKIDILIFQGIEQQFAALQKGFTEVVPQHLLKPFDERELELIIGGLGKIDIDDWKANTRLKVSIILHAVRVTSYPMKNLLLKSFHLEVI